MPDAAERAAARRRNWRGGVAHSVEEMERIDLEQWLGMSAANRLRSMWSLLEDSLVLEGERGPARRLQRSVGGVRPLRGSVRLQCFTTVRGS